MVAHCFSDRFSRVALHSMQGRRIELCTYRILGYQSCFGCVLLVIIGSLVAREITSRLKGLVLFL